MTHALRRVDLGAFVLMAAVTLTSACSGSSDSSSLPSVTSPTTTTGTSSGSTTTATAVVETFTGEITQGTYGLHPFTMAARGTLTFKLTDLQPLTTLTVGAGLGTWDGTNCTLITNGYSETAKVNFTVSGTASIGNYCAAVWDVGNIMADSKISYTITVEHY